MKKIDKTLLRKVLTVVGIVAFFLVISYAFVPEVLSGKIVNQGDISSWRGMANEAVTYNAAHPEDKTHWTDSMFGGMPTTATIDDFDGDWTKFLYKFLLTGRRPATYFFIALLGGFLLMLSFGCGVWVAVGGAIAIAFCAYNWQIIQVGHNTKMQAIAFFPWVLAGVAYTYRRALGGLRKASSEAAGDKGTSTAEGPRDKALGWRSWLPGTVLGAALFALALSFQIKANHPQITYYLAIVIFVYALTLLGYVLATKENRKTRVGRFFAASALLLVLGCVGIATNANKLIPTYNYAKYTMRGGSELAADKAEHAGDPAAVKEAKAAAKGLDLEYATAWSYGPNEMPNLLIPNFNGGASSCDPHLKNGATESLLRKAGQPNVKQTVKALPMYWGPQPFTAGPMYLGAVSIFLFILGLFLLRGEDRRLKVWVIIASLIAIFLAWGSHFMWFTRLWFNYVPMYNKFRTVSMALVVLQVTVPLLGFVTLDKIVREKYDKKQVQKALWWALGLVGGFCLLFALFPGLAGDFSAASDQGMQDILTDALREDRRAMLRKDAFRSLTFVVLAAILILWSTRAKGPFAAKGRTYIMGGILAVVVLLDLGSVGKRYLRSEDFVSPKNWQAQFKERGVDKQILSDKDLSYRVLDLSVNTFNDAHPSYRHKCIGGYSPVKLQRYQDLIERYISPEINSIYKAAGSAATVSELEENLPMLPVTSLLNGKYIVLGDDIAPLRNPHAMGNCWIVTGARVASSVNEEIDLLGKVDLANTVVLGPDFKEIVPNEAFTKVEIAGGTASEGVARDESAQGANAAVCTDDSVVLTSYEPNELHYRCHLSRKSAVMFSEIYYPEGWKAWIGPVGKVGQTKGDRFEAGSESTWTTLFRGDWMLRGLIVPQGDWEVVMRFEPKDYKIGENISSASSALLLALVLLSIGGAALLKKE